MKTATYSVEIQPFNSCRSRKTVNMKRGQAQKEFKDAVLNDGIWKVTLTVEKSL